MIKQKVVIKYVYLLPPDRAHSQKRVRSIILALARAQHSNFVTLDLSLNRRVGERLFLSGLICTFKWKTLMQVRAVLAAT